MRSIQCTWRPKLATVWGHPFKIQNYTTHSVKEENTLGQMVLKETSFAGITRGIRLSYAWIYVSVTPVHDCWSDLHAIIVWLNLMSQVILLPNKAQGLLLLIVFHTIIYNWSARTYTHPPICWQMAFPLFRRQNINKTCYSRRKSFKKNVV